MDHFSLEHLDHLRNQLAFKRAVVEHIKANIDNSTTEVGDFDTNYLAQLTHAPLLDKLDMDILELEVSVKMLSAYLRY